MRKVFLRFDSFVYIKMCSAVPAQEYLFTALFGCLRQPPNKLFPQKPLFQCQSCWSSALLPLDGEANTGGSYWYNQGDSKPCQMWCWDSFPQSLVKTRIITLINRDGSISSNKARWVLSSEKATGLCQETGHWAEQTCSYTLCSNVIFYRSSLLWFCDSGHSAKPTAGALPSHLIRCRTPG